MQFSENQIALTVAIPTWNRANFLSELLNQLVQQIHQYDLMNHIEILISDNNSEDHTFDVVRNFSESESYITYHKNETNIGAKSNVIKSMEMASGEYVMLIGDDDRIRNNCLADILSLIKYKHCTAFIDIGDFRWKAHQTDTIISTDSLLENYYWVIGNAGHYVVQSNVIKRYTSRFGYDFFNECWPHTQLIILGLTEKDANCMVCDLKIQEPGLHTELMIYNSNYLWRTCYYELLLAINSIKPHIPISAYNSARSYMYKSLPQQLYNIIQCGVFVDAPDERRKTVQHIKDNLYRFSFKEKIFLRTILFILSLPVVISRFFMNCFIYILKGKSGMNKKNQFVAGELKKKNAQKVKKSSALRQLDFER